MDSILCNLLNEIKKIALVLDSSRKIIWRNSYSEEKMKGIEVVNKKFSEIGSVESEEKILSIPNLGSFVIEEINIGNADEDKILFLKPLQNLWDDNFKAITCEEILNNVNDGIIVTDYEGKIIYFNKVQESIEKKSEDMVGKYLWNVYDYDSEEESEHRNVFRNGEPVLNKYRLMHYRDGLPRYISYNTYPIVIEDRVLGVYSVSKSEEKLHSMLSEVIDIKRKYISLEERGTLEKIDNGTTYSFSDIVGSSEETRKLIKEAENIALLDRNILIIGETGTGKEVYAQSIHNYGKKRTEPFVAINCGAIPENLMESILFGTVKGAYTGSVDTVGLFEKAKEGTLFLDELNSLPVYMQTKL